MAVLVTDERSGAARALASLICGLLVLVSSCKFIDATYIACRTSADCPSGYLCGGSNFCSSQPTSPGVPTNVVAAAGKGGVLVTWTPPASDGGSPITGYLVFPMNNSMNMNGQQPANVAAGVTHATVTGLAAGQTYVFTVAAVNGNGQSQQSAPSNAVIPGTVPGAPTMVKAQAGNTQVTVSWGPPTIDGYSPITGYTVTSSPETTTLTFGASAGSATLTGLTNGTAYEIEVTATNAYGTGDVGYATPEPVIPAAAPGAPTAVSATPGAEQCTVTWTAPAMNGGTDITLYTVISNPGNVTSTTMGTIGTTVTGLASGTAYTFTVTASNDAATSPPSLPSPAVTTFAAPGAPTNVTATGGIQKATVTWVAPAIMGGSPISGYTVTASPGGVSATTTGPTTVQVPGLTAGNHYTFTVVATSAAGTGPASAASNSVLVVGPAVVSAGSNLIVSPASVAADGHSSIAISLTLKDASGEVLAATPVSLNVTGAANQLLPPSGVTNASGVFTSSLTSTEEGMKTVIATAGSLTLTATVTFSAVPWSCTGEFTQDPAVTLRIPIGPEAVWVGDFNGDGRADLAVAGGGVAVFLGGASTGLTAVAGGPFQLSPTAGQAQAMTGGDFNGDGKLDLAVVDDDCVEDVNDGTCVTGQYQTMLTVMLGNGQGSFSANIPRPVNATPGGSSGLSAAAADFNGDGALDLAVLQSGATSIAVLYGDGSGKFTLAPTPTMIAASPDAITAGDFNGDGKADFAVTIAASNAVYVFLANAQEAFTVTAASPITVGQGPSAITAGDFTGDGKLDLAVANATDDTVTILSGDGTGAFAPVAGTPMTVGSDPAAIVAVDLNGDGNLDLAVANYSSDDASVLLGDGTGHFTRESGSPFPVGNGTDAIVAGDFNGDGHLDLAVANNQDESVSLLWTSCWTKPGAPTQVAAFGSNQAAWVTWTPPSDGGTPIFQYTVTVSPGGGTVTSSEPSVLFPGLATGSVYTFTVTATNAVGTGPASPSSNSVTVDGPLLLAGSSLVVSPTTVTADGRSGATITLTAKDAAGHLLAGIPVVLKVSGPGNQWLPFSGVTGGSGAFTSVLTSTLAGTKQITATAGSATFTSSVVFSAAPWSSCMGSPSFNVAAAIGQPATQGPYQLIEAGDFNGDGHQDIAVIDWEAGTLNTLPGNGMGGFGAPIASPNAVVQNTTDIGMGDFNNDGILDLAVVTNVTSPPGLVVLLGDGTGAFAASSSGSTSVSGAAQSLSDLVVADFNGDGNLDIALGEYTSSSTVAILLGDGTGGFTNASGSPISVPSASTSELSLVAGDFDGNGVPDLAYAGAGGDIILLLANGDGTFTQHTAATLGTTEQTIIAMGVADFNGDGKLDLMLQTEYSSDLLVILLGDGAGALVAQSPIMSTGQYVGFALGDFNGDRLVDEAGGTGSPQVAVLLGASGPTLAASPWSPYTLPTPVSRAPVLADFNEDGHLDILTAGTGVGLLLNACWTVPGAPELVTATPGVNQATVSWAPPVNGGGSAITAYTVTSIPPGGQATTTGATTVVVTGLTADTNYTFTVTATNGIGMGAASGASNSVKVSGPPSAGMSSVTSSPTSVRADGISAATLTAKWLDAAGEPAVGVPMIFIATGTDSSILPPSGVTNAAGVLTASMTTTQAGMKTVTAKASTATGALGTIGSSIVSVTGSVTFTPVTCSQTFSFPTTPTEITTAGSQPEAVVAADFNRDGKLDLAVASPADGNLSVLLGNGDGTFMAASGSPYAISVDTPTWLALGDFNADGNVDIAVTAYVSISNQPDSVVVMFGDGTGGFSAPLWTGATAQSFTVGDFNADGWPDLVETGSSSPPVLFYTGNGLGAFTQVSNFATGLPPGFLQRTAADFNSDGLPDVAFLSNTLNVFLDPVGGFTGFPSSTTANPITVGTTPSAVASADFNNDGSLDLAVADQGSGEVTILLGNGSGGFTATSSPPHVGSGPVSLTAGDFNGDGIMDLAVANESDNDVSVLIGTGHGVFMAAGESPFTAGTSPRWIVTGDFNGDGRLDLAVANAGSASAGSGSVSILLNQCP